MRHSFTQSLPSPPQSGMADYSARYAMAGSLSVVAAALMLVVWLISGFVLNLIAFLCFGFAAALFFRRILNPSPAGDAKAPQGKDPLP